MDGNAAPVCCHLALTPSWVSGQSATHNGQHQGSALPLLWTGSELWLKAAACGAEWPQWRPSHLQGAVVTCLCLINITIYKSSNLKVFICFINYSRAKRNKPTITVIWWVSWWKVSSQISGRRTQCLVEQLSSNGSQTSPSGSSSCRRFHSKWLSLEQENWRYILCCIHGILKMY